MMAAHDAMGGIPGAESPFSFGAGIYVLGISALVLAALALKKPANV
jgi:hypothetical protein